MAGGAGPGARARGAGRAGGGGARGPGAARGAARGGTVGAGRGAARGGRPGAPPPRRLWSARERRTALALGRLRPGAWEGALRLAEGHGLRRLPPWLVVECLAAAVAHLARQPRRVRWLAARRDLRLRALLAAARRSVDDLDLDGLLGALFAFGALRESTGGASDPLLSEAGARDLAQLLEERILEELELQGARGAAGRKFGPALLSFARLGHRPGGALVAALEAELPRVLFAFSPAGVCQALWGFARVGRDPGSGLLSRLALEGRDRLGGMSAGMIARALFSFGRLGFYPGRQVAAAYVEEFGSKISQASAQDVAHALWGCARVGHGLGRAPAGERPGFLELCAARLAQLAGAPGGAGCLNPKLVSSALWAFSRYDFHPGEECMAALTAYLESDLGEFELVGQGLVWYALSRIQHQPGPRALAAAEAALRAKVGEVWEAAAAAAGGASSGGEGAWRGPEEVLPEGEPGRDSPGTAARAASVGPDLTSAFRSTTFVLFGCAKLALDPPDALLGTVCGALSEWAPLAEPWDLAVALWSLAVLRVPSPEARALVGELWAALAESDDLQLGAQGAMMLFHAYVAFSLEQPDVELELNEALVEAGRVEWRRAHLLDDVQGSYLQRDVAVALERLGLPHRFEQLISGELFRTDIFLPEASLAVEVDGPTHFLANRPTEPNGATRLRDRLLRQRGHEVMAVPHFEWAALDGPAAKQAYLRERLAAAGVQVPEAPEPLDLAGGFAERVAEAGREADEEQRRRRRSSSPARPPPPFADGEERDDEGAALAPPTPGEIRAALRAAEEAQAADGEGAELPPVTLGLEGLAEALWDEDPEADGAGLMGDERFEDLFSEEEGDEA